MLKTCLKYKTFVTMVNYTTDLIIELSLIIIICKPSMSAFSQEIWVYGDNYENFEKWGITLAPFGQALHK